ncbi:MAG: hypothetical protein WCQ47_03180 [bacterium]
MKRFFILIFSLSLFLSSSPYAKADSSEDQRIKEIDTLAQNIEMLKQQLTTAHTNLDKENIEAKIKDSELAFDDVATDSDLFSPDDEPVVKDKDVWQELQEVLKPVVQSLKRASEKPRRIEQIRNNISDLEQRIDDAQYGISNVDELLQKYSSGVIFKRLQESKDRTLKIQKDLQAEKDSLQDQLNEDLKDDRSFLYTSKLLLGDFFTNKGKNLLFAIVLSVAVFWLLVLFKRFALKPLLHREKFYFISKPFMALYGVFAVIISVGAGLLCLFLLNDWFLFIVIIIMIGLIFWGFKHLFVGLFSAIKIIFDLGTVREGQRIIFNSCPWLVKKIGLQTILQNESLQSGEIRIGISRIKDLTSRPVIDGEPWFPTNQGDSVILEDGTYGKIFLQTPEQVIISTSGETKKFYTISDFIAQKPNNLSYGFQISTSIDVDYSLQPDIHDVVKIFRNSLILKLREHKLSTRVQRKGVGVYFGGSKESSLNIIAEVRFEGELAPYYLELKREVDLILVNICTDNNFSIPYKQLSVHIAD